MEKNIRANCISPGGIKNKSQSKKFIWIQKLTPLGRLANPDDQWVSLIFNKWCIFLYTGSNLIIDGGWTSW